MSVYIIVVDASVAASAGGSDHPLSKSCRNALITIRGGRHKIIVTRKIQQEWSAHARYFAHAWLASMVARKRVLINPETQPIECQKASSHLSPKELRELEKDIHLIEAACCGDRTILTRDDEIVRIWDKIEGRCYLCDEIKWLHPLRTEDVEYLK